MHPVVLPLPRAAALLLGACLGLAPTLRADDVAGHRAHLQMGPLMGGQNLVVDLRTTFPNDLAGLFIGFARTPLVGNGPFDPVFGLDITTADLFLSVIDGTGRDFLSLPTAPGMFGPVGLGIVAHFQYLIVPDNHPWVTSNTVSVEIEPLGVAPGYLVDEAATRLPAGYDSLNAGQVVAADLDKDGDADLVLVLEGDLRIWINDGTGTYGDETSARISYPTGAALGVIAVVDVNRDNYPDIVTGGGFDDSVSVSQPDLFWNNQGDGTFVVSTGGFPISSGLTRDFEFADFDGDAQIDVVVASGAEAHVSSPTGRDRLYFGLGGYVTPTWNESVPFADAAWNDDQITTTAFTAGDVDNDGDLDLVASRIDTLAVDGTVGQPNLVLLNNGSGTFVDASGTRLSPNPSDNTSDVALADIDADGDMDIAFANSHGSILPSASGDLYLNQGGQQLGTAGFFVEDASSELEISTPADWVRLNAEFADMDADGDVDLLMSIHDLFAGADQLLFVNQGGAQNGVAGALVRQFWFDPGDFICYGIAVADIDLDGDNDLVQTGQGVVSGDPDLGDDVRLFVNGNL